MCPSTCWTVIGPFLTDVIRIVMVMELLQPIEALRGPGLWSTLPGSCCGDLCDLAPSSLAFTTGGGKCCLVGLLVSCSIWFIHFPTFFLPVCYLTPS